MFAGKMPIVSVILNNGDSKEKNTQKIGIIQV